ncbi:lymphocyte antigen 6H-like isoform X2 [Mustela nigripes]|nr:lymphocyte antigen 6H isoform X2 [Mustela putorius furo]XP_012904901.1 lymphocyte antigen 6H isoform X2 [Mustela putorius furo]XP_044930197.1 lymphocyte antigen 6H-like isoform X2 [Mustela putorius furo]XP_044930198.1 lymphocyte antigen 6H-like isoform X2 [Mustela putorius furo]XP_059248963.1 lymphocyte antigen 6H-like isoform X2 [Mustela nigripes]XP_059248964.1 lymphocyte antigen 6H-like isoform X2 [Mustela nigripes]
MTGLHLFLLAILLCWERAPALSLQCYTCIDMENGGPCQPLPCPMPGVCYSSNMTLTKGDGKQLKYQQKGCAPSCDEVSRVMQQLSQMSPMDVLDPADLQGQPKFESQGLVCCEKDLCNGGTGHLGPGGGLLLSLGPILLWALL